MTPYGCFGMDHPVDGEMISQLSLAHSLSFTPRGSIFWLLVLPNWSTGIGLREMAGGVFTFVRLLFCAVAWWSGLATAPVWGRVISWGS